MHPTNLILPYHFPYFVDTPQNLYHVSKIILKGLKKKSPFHHIFLKSFILEDKFNFIDQHDKTWGNAKGFIMTDKEFKIYGCRIE